MNNRYAMFHTTLRYVTAPKAFNGATHSTMTSDITVEHMKAPLLRSKEVPSMIKLKSLPYGNDSDEMTSYPSFSSASTVSTDSDSHDSAI